MFCGSAGNGRVLNLLRWVALVILHAGSTARLVWEVEQFARRVKPQRLLVLIPLNRHEYDEFRRNVAVFSVSPAGLQGPQYGTRPCTPFVFR